LAVASCWLLMLPVSADMGPSRWLSDGARVYDRKTDLTWQRCVYGQRFDPATASCSGLPQPLTFDAAKRLEGQGWRVPRLDELVSLVARSAVPAIDNAAFPGTPATYFWATDNRDLAAAWYVSFEDGRTNHYYPPRTNRDLVRFVRSGRWNQDAGPVSLSMPGTTPP
jgi:hypothetical protein